MFGLQSRWLKVPIVAQIQSLAVQSSCRKLAIGRKILNSAVYLCCFAGVFSDKVLYIFGTNIYEILEVLVHIYVHILEYVSMRIYVCTSIRIFVHICTYQSLSVC